MMDRPSDDEDAARLIAKEIADFREEFWGKICSDVESEVEELEENGYDPAKGSGRGPRWAEGA